MSLSPAVHAENDIAHLTVGKIYDIVIYQHSVGREREVEYLVMLLLELSAVFHEFLADIPVDQWLTAEEVHLEVPSAAGILNEVIKRPLAYFQTHYTTFARILAFAGKTVLAVHIAAMRNMKAYRLEYGLFDLELDS